MFSPVALDLHAERRAIVATLDAAGVAYALAGGLAVSIYATPRATDGAGEIGARDEKVHVLEQLGPLGFRAAGPPTAIASGRLHIQRLIETRARI